MKQNYPRNTETIRCKVNGVWTRRPIVRVGEWRKAPGRFCGKKWVTIAMPAVMLGESLRETPEGWEITTEHPELN